MPVFQIKLSLPDFNSDVPFLIDCEPTSISELALIFLEQIGGFSEEEIQRINGDKLPLRLLGELCDDQLIELNSDAQMRVFLATAGDKPTIVVRPADPSAPPPSVAQQEISLSTPDALWARLGGNEGGFLGLAELTRGVNAPSTVIAKSFAFVVGNVAASMEERISKTQFCDCVLYLQSFLELQYVMDQCLGPSAAGDRRITEADFSFLVPKINDVGFSTKVQDFAQIAKGDNTLFLEELCDGLVKLRLRPSKEDSNTTLVVKNADAVDEEELPSTSTVIQLTPSSDATQLPESSRDTVSAGAALVLCTTPLAQTTLPSTTDATQSASPLLVVTPKASLSLTPTTFDKHSNPESERRKNAGRPPVPPDLKPPNRKSALRTGPPIYGPSQAAAPLRTPPKTMTRDPSPKETHAANPRRSCNGQHLEQLHNDHQRRAQKLAQERARSIERQSDAWHEESEAILAKSKREVFNYVPPQYRYYKEQQERERRRSEAVRSSGSDFADLQPRTSVEQRHSSGLPVHERLYQEQQERARRKKERAQEYARIEMAECRSVPKLSKNSRNQSSAPSLSFQADSNTASGTTTRKGTPTRLKDAGPHPHAWTPTRVSNAELRPERKPVRLSDAEPPFAESTQVKLRDAESQVREALRGSSAAISSSDFSMESSGLEIFPQRDNGSHHISAQQSALHTFIPKPRTAPTRSLRAEPASEGSTRHLLHEARGSSMRRSSLRPLRRASSLDGGRLDNRQDEQSTSGLEEKLAFVEDLHRSALVRLRRSREECDLAYHLLDIERGKLEVMENMLRARG